MVLISNPWLGTAPIINTSVVAPASLPDNLKIIRLVSDSSLSRMLSNKAAAGAFLSLSNALSLNTLSENSYCIAMITARSIGADAILARHDWQVDSQDTIRVGMEDSHLARYVLNQWLQHHGVSQERIEIQALQPQQQAAAWTGHKVDLIVTYEPFIEPLRHRGAKVIFDSSHPTMHVTNVLLVDRTRWQLFEPLVSDFRERTWPQTLKRLAGDDADFMQGLQKLSNYNSEQLAKALDTIEFVTSAEQQQAFRQLLQEDMPKAIAAYEATGAAQQAAVLGACPNIVEQAL
ncbi:hypothetical protein [Pseudidiomarina piscicola]|nr:hypothetical protein [Pseudidiomarina piscicola]